jgi:uncharacterized protein (TIGR03435 family)
MKPDRHAFEKNLTRYLSLFGSPSVIQIDASRTRVRERLRSRHETSVSDAPANVRSSGARYDAWRAGLSLAAATTVIVLVVTVPSRQTDWLATVEAADGSRYTLEPHAVLRSPDAGGTMLTLKDGSRVEMRSQSELSLEHAPDGIGIRLRTGGLLVDAARQHDGHLYVHTKDVTVSVVRTMFVVNTEDSGSRVTVIEGEVRVREGAIEKALKPGEQVSTNAALAKRPMKEEIGWSRRADAILAAFAKGMSDTAGSLQPFAKPANAASAERAAVAQTVRPERPEFESASVRECDPDDLPPPPDGARGGGVNSFQLIPGRLRALCVTLATLIRTAYGYGPIELDFIFRGGGPRGMTFGSVYGLGVEDGRRVRGGPDWVRSDRYTIEAVAPADVRADAQTLRDAMLQRLLERRFQLKAHIESEDTPAFALTVAKSGPKIKPVGLDACDQLPGKPGALTIDGFPGSVLTRPRSFAEVRAGQKPSCGIWGGRNGPNATFVGGGVTLSGLANVLGARLGGVRVFDRTGFTSDERFNFVLEFAVDENAPGLPGGDLPPRADSADVPRAATVFTVLEEELGLKLEPDRTSREFIVIDHVERPSPN